jgi:hypothetical protein
MLVEKLPETVPGAHDKSPAWDDDSYLTLLQGILPSNAQKQRFPVVFHAGNSKRQNRLGDCSTH